MSGTQTQTKTKATAQNGPKKPARPVGPKNLYLIFHDGVDPNTMRASIAAVTFNGRKMLQELSSGNMRPFLIYKVEVEKRNTAE